MAVSSKPKSYRLPKILATGVETHVVGRQNRTDSYSCQQENALRTIPQGGNMRICAAGDKKQAWMEICQCPLMREIMKDPVVASDGITYERQSIQEWMQSSDISPWDNQPFETKDLTPNSLVLNFISQFGLA